MIYEDIVYDNKSDKNKINLYLSDVPNGNLYIYIHGGGLDSGTRSDNLVLFSALNKAGISVVSIDYRVYPDAKYPEFIEDCAKAIAFVKSEILKYGVFTKTFIGGTSAGAYITMMLFFNPQYLSEYGIEIKDYNGFVFDAGQPTTHYNVLNERGEDGRLLRIDEAAPIYYITKDFIHCPKIQIIVADDDIVNRLEQNYLLKRTMEHFNYPSDKIEINVLKGYSHCGYMDDKKYHDIIYHFING